MTNGEKYKTARERAEAFDRFCKSNTTDEGLCMPDCKLFHAQDDSKCYCGHCEFRWLDLEAEEEPETIDDVIADMGKTVEMMRKKESEGDTLFHVSVIFDKFLNRTIAAHNRVAKKCMEVKE